MKVIIHEAEEGGYWAEVPALPGRITEGDTRAELPILQRPRVPYLPAATALRPEQGMRLRLVSIMQPEEILSWACATPFVPFRILMNSGRIYEVGSPSWCSACCRGSVVLFTSTHEPALCERMEMLGMVSMERVEPLPAPAARPGDGNAAS